MSNSAFLSRLSYFTETTQGTGPADGAAWLASGQSIRHIAESLDPSSIKRETVVDDRSQISLQGTEQTIGTISNPEVGFEAAAHGLGVATANGMVVPDVPFHALIEHALGGRTRGTSRVLAAGGHTDTVLNFDDISTTEPGDFIAVEPATPPAGFSAGLAWLRRVTDVTGLAVTIDQALPFTPADADAIHGTSVEYVDEAVICDSDGAGGPFTRSWLIEKGFPTQPETWELRGSVAMLQAFGFPRGEPTKMPFTIMASSHSAPGVAPTPAWLAATTPAGFAGLPIGVLTETWLADIGSTVSDNTTLMRQSQFQVEPGVPRTRTETGTEAQVGMEGTASFASEPADTTVTFSQDPFSGVRLAEFRDGDFKQLRWSKIAPAGGGLAVHFSRVSYIEEPARGTNNATSRIDITFKAHPDVLFSPPPSNTARQISKIIIIGW